MGHPSFGVMWPSRNPYVVTLVRKDGLRLPIHRELVELVRMLMDLTELMGYDIKPGETWGYAYRAISGTNTPSNHSQATAVDINAPSNPYASAEWHRANARGTKPFGLQIVCDIPEKVISLWENYGWEFGGRWTSKPDPMHFEFEGNVEDARRLTAALKKWITNEGVWTVSAEKKLDALTNATKRQTNVIIRQNQKNRRADLARELREANRNKLDTKEIVSAINELDNEIASGRELEDG